MLLRRRKKKGVCGAHRRRAPSSNRRFGSFASRVSSTRADLRMRASASCIRQTSRFCLRPNSPMSFISLSRRSFSKGRRGVRDVLPWFRRKEVCGMVVLQATRRAGSTTQAATRL